jgi:hypothetical protein
VVMTRKNPMSPIPKIKRFVSNGNEEEFGAHVNMVKYMEVNDSNKLPAWALMQIIEI